MGNEIIFRALPGGYMLIPNMSELLNVLGVSIEPRVLQWGNPASHYRVECRNLSGMTHPSQMDWR